MLITLDSIIPPVPNISGSAVNAHTSKPRARLPKTPGRHPAGRRADHRRGVVRRLARHPPGRRGDRRERAGDGEVRRLGRGVRGQQRRDRRQREEQQRRPGHGQVGEQERLPRQREHPRQALGAYDDAQARAHRGPAEQAEERRDEDDRAARAGLGSGIGHEHERGEQHERLRRPHRPDQVAVHQRRPAERAAGARSDVCPASPAAGEQDVVHQAEVDRRQRAGQAGGQVRGVAEDPSRDVRHCGASPPEERGGDHHEERGGRETDGERHGRHGSCAVSR